MRRGFWFAAGAGAGVWAVVRARRVAEAVTPDGMRDRIGAAWIGATILRDEMAQGMVDAEADLRERYGAPALGPGGRPGRELPAHEPPDEAPHDTQRGTS